MNCLSGLLIPGFQLVRVRHTAGHFIQKGRVQTHRRMGFQLVRVRHTAGQERNRVLIVEGVLSFQLVRVRHTAGPVVGARVC